MNASNSTKIALVTGGVTGIGRAIVLRLTKDEFCVVVNYKNSKKEKGYARKKSQEIGSGTYISLKGPRERNSPSYLCQRGRVKNIFY